MISVELSEATIIMFLAVAIKHNQIMEEKYSQLGTIINLVGLYLLLIQKDLELLQLFNLKNWLS